jgi:uncharacterized membrane protein
MGLPERISYPHNEPSSGLVPGCDQDLFRTPRVINVDQSKQFTTSRAQGLSSVVERNVSKLIERREQERRRAGFHERLALRVSRFAGSFIFVYLHAAFFGGWILINALPTPIPKFDPSLVVLAMFASVEAIFLSTFVLITQNRMSAEAEKRAELDLQISLLAEHEITRLIVLVSELARKAGVEQTGDRELDELKQDVAPEEVLDHIEERRASE